MYQTYLWSNDVTITNIFLKYSKHAWSSLLFKFLSNLSLNKYIAIMIFILFYNSRSKDKTVHYFHKICNSYNMSTMHMLDIAICPCKPEGHRPKVQAYKYQVNSKHPCYKWYVTLSHLRSKKCLWLNVMYHKHSSPDVLQLPWCATTSLVCYNFP